MTDDELIITIGRWIVRGWPVPKVKGRGHVERVALGRPWKYILPGEDIVDTRRAGGYFGGHFYTSVEIWQRFKAELKTWGVTVNDRHPHHYVITDREKLSAALVAMKLRGEFREDK